MKKPINQFEDDLGKLVDRYLLEGLAGDDIKSVLNYEAKYDYAERLTELRKEKAHV
jgi:hypothetical protein